MRKRCSRPWLLWPDSPHDRHDRTHSTTVPEKGGGSFPSLITGPSHGRIVAGRPPAPFPGLFLPGVLSTMRTVLAKCCVLALIAGGFAFTGDAARVFARGRRVLESTTLPRHAAESAVEGPSAAAADQATPPRSGHDAVAVAPSEPPVPEGEPTGSEPAAPVAAAEAATQTMPQALAPPADAPIGTPAAGMAPPASSPESIDLATLSPGDRIVVWVGRRGSRKGPAGSMTIALDVIDPQSAEVLEQRHAGGGEQGASHAPLRRIRILGSATESFLGGVTPTGPTGRISRRQSLRIVPTDRESSRQDANASQPEQTLIETIGPVQAMAVTRVTTVVP